MSQDVTYTPNGGQTYMPFKDNTHIDFVAYEKPLKPDPLLPELELSQKFIDMGFVLPSQKQHFLPGVTAEMMDWFWATWKRDITCGLPDHTNVSVGSESHGNMA
ncbi:MAG: hypothetical protein V8R80_09430 [Eubacterium sp.]